MSQSTASAPAADLWDQFSYNPLTGKFYSRKTGKLIPGTAFVDQRNYSGLRVTASFNGRVRSVAYGRAVYSWLTGVVPGKGFHVDHINHNAHDNRPWNLRCVTVRENNQNRRNQGSVGIYWNTRLRKWQAQIRVGGEKVYLGVYTSEAAALERYIAACDLHGYAVLNSVRNRRVALEQPEACEVI
jgi:hypothetical protein